jgi:hypothetical protein
LKLFVFVSLFCFFFLLDYLFFPFPFLCFPSPLTLPF